MVYQEDVSRTAHALAGFSHAEADRLRKVMTNKDREHEMADYRDRFFQGAMAKGVARDKIQAVWEMMLSFSGYSFCKPHSASYARVSFQAAYLKAGHPAEFMAAVISNQGGFYSTFAYVSEARRLGLTILPPDVNESQARWIGQGRTVRVGLMAVKDLGHQAMERIIRERQSRPYNSFDDFCQRVRPEASEARALIQAGALDSVSVGESHAQLLWRLAWRRNSKKAPTGLFAAGCKVDPPELPPDKKMDRLRRQFAVLGFLPDRHPIVLFAGALNGNGLVKAADLDRHAGRRVRLAGWLITGKTVSTKAGQPMQFLTFEDETGVVETTFFPAAYRRFWKTLDRNRPYVLAGKVEENYGATTLTVDGVRKDG